MEGTSQESTLDINACTPAARLSPASAFHRRLDRLCHQARSRKLSGKRRRSDNGPRTHSRTIGARRPDAAATVEFSGSVYYVFAAAVGLLEEVAAGGTAERLLHVVPSANVVGTGSLALRVSPAERSFKNSPAAARAILRDLMGAGQELFCIRTRHLFTSAFHVEREAQLAVAQREWAWPAMTPDQRLRWAYAAFRVQYLTRSLGVVM